ncbi:MAG: hypothetical protein C9356_05275 [Oleiphilus sp.]|nr:MAG: hypothetical protein C9356_05275 [Oleiphilus sp.]
MICFTTAIQKFLLLGCERTLAFQANRGHYMRFAAKTRAQFSAKKQLKHKAPVVQFSSFNLAGRC